MIIDFDFYGVCVYYCDRHKNLVTLQYPSPFGLFWRERPKREMVFRTGLAGIFRIKILCGRRVPLSFLAAHTRASTADMQGGGAEDASPMPAWRPASRLVPNHSVAARVRQMRADQHGTSLSSSELSATPDMFASHHGSVSSHSGPPSRSGTLSTAMERVIRVERKRAGKVRATCRAARVRQVEVCVSVGRQHSRRHAGSGCMRASRARVCAVR
jgi:hypothetical protein